MNKIYVFMGGNKKKITVTKYFECFISWLGLLTQEGAIIPLGFESSHGLRRYPTSIWTQVN